MLGIERAELLGRKLSDFVVREEQDQFYLHCRKLFGEDLAEGHPATDNHKARKQTIELTLRRTGGNLLSLRLDCVVFGLPRSAERSSFQEKTFGAVAPEVFCRIALIDITEIKLAEQARQESEEQFKLIADTVPDILYLCDAEDRRYYVNPQFYRFTGMPPGEAEGCGWQEAVHPDDLDALLASKNAAARRGEAWEAKFRLRSAGGDYHWFIGKAHAVLESDGSIKHWLGCDTDIDQLVRIEQALYEEGRCKDEFLAMLGHELRNPLAAISNAAQLFSDPDLDAIRRGRAHDMLARNIKYMARLVDDLLDTSRITSGTILLHKERVDLETVVKNSVETVQPLFDEKNHRLHVEFPSQPIYLHGDAMRLVQVISNILQNAAKYTAPGGDIDLSVGTEGGYACIRIRDNGMGIPKELLVHVFDIFRQDQRGLERAEGGLGLGLTLVKKLVELHGGNVTAYSDGENQGAEFVVRLPLLAGVIEKAEIEEPSPRGVLPCRQRVLLVEDHPDVADSLAALLELYGHSVQIATDGPHGLAIAKQFKPDIVLLDIGIPGMDGYELAKHLRAEEVLSNMTIIALSGCMQSADDVKRGAEAGIDHYLLKPVDPAKLVELFAEPRPGGSAST
jgi:PAS domain S-box-containing protein